MSATPAPKLAPVTEQIDSHLHLWDLTAGRYPWLGPQHGELYASFGPQQAHDELTACGVSGAVVVQAEDSLVETDDLLALADEHPWLVGVVGWLPLADTRAAVAALEQRLGDPRLRGVRHLVHDDPRPDFLMLPAVRDSLRELARAGLAFDVPDAWPRHLDQITDVASAAPELTVVIDHLAKPPRGDDGELARWRTVMAEAAARPNTVAKVSGLRLPGAAYSADALRPVWEAALDLFGPERLMYGSDWPMTVPDGGYRPTYDVLAALVAELSATEQQQVMAGTARRAYGLPPPGGSGATGHQPRIETGP